MYSQFFSILCTFTEYWMKSSTVLYCLHREQKKPQTDSNRHDFQMLLTRLKTDLEGNTSKIRVNISEACFVAWTCSEKKFIGFIFICVFLYVL